MDEDGVVRSVRAQSNVGSRIVARCVAEPWLHQPPILAGARSHDHFGPVGVPSSERWVDRLDAVVRPLLWVVLLLAVAYIIGVGLASTWCQR